MLSLRPARTPVGIIIALAGVLITVAGCLGSAPTPTPTLEPTPTPTPTAPPPVYRDWPTLPTPTHSIQVFMWWELEVAVRDLDLVRDMGFTWVKQKFPWRDIEGIERGARDWFRPDFLMDLVDEKGLNIIVRLDQQPFWSQVDGGAVPLPNAPPADFTAFGDFCFAVAERYAGRIDAYQVWNEPNLSREWGNQPPDPEAYVELLKECYTNIKAADPNAIVISAGLAPTSTIDPANVMPHEEFLRRMYQAGAQPYFDMLGVHAPGYQWPPDTSPEMAVATGAQRWMVFRHVEDIRAIMLEYDDPNKQIAILEFGWTTDPINPDFAWFAVDDEVQAENLVGAYDWAAQHWNPWVGLMSMIYMADPDWDPTREEFWWAITWPGFPEPVLRPAYYALRDMEK